MKKKILIGFGLPLVIFLSGSILAVLYITRTTERMDKLITLHQVEILREDLIIHVQQVQSRLSRGKTWSGGDVDALIAQVQEMDRVMDSCIGCHHTPELTQGLLVMHDVADEYTAAIRSLITASADPTRISEFERRAQDLGQDLITMTQGMAFTANVRLQQKTQETMDTIRDVRMVLYSTLIFGVFLTVFAASLLTRSLDRGLRKLIGEMRRVSRGELQHRVELNDAPGSEFLELGEAFNTMTRNLHLSQRQMVQSAKLAAIGDLAASIAYEVNNPLTGVLGYTSLLLKADDIPADKKEQLKTIERETIRVRDILKALPDLSRRKPLRLVKTDIPGLIQGAILQMQEQARLNNVEIATVCPGGLPPVAVDADEMKQVFVNLIDNAFFSMPKGGTLTVRCTQCRDLTDKEAVAVEFADTGKGIPKEHLDKIFDPFFTMRPDGGGTGLGLSISYLVVLNHGGRIDVESNVSEGSTFRVVLPA